jgi:hypothetical protein
MKDDPRRMSRQEAEARAASHRRLADDPRASAETRAEAARLAPMLEATAKRRSVR